MLMFISIACGVQTILQRISERNTYQHEKNRMSFTLELDALGLCSTISSCTFRWIMLRRDSASERGLATVAWCCV